MHEQWTERIVLVLILLALPAITSFASTDREELRLKKVLLLAARISPDLKTSRSKEVEAEQSTRIASSKYFPTLDLAAVDSIGFAGSPGDSTGFGGLMASPYRKGPSFGVFSKWSLLDFSVDHEVESTQQELLASREKTRIKTIQVYQSSLQIYLEAVRYRGEDEAWRRIVDELIKISVKVKQFVKNGQYSDVAHLLIEDQLKEAIRQQTAFHQRYETTLKRIALLTGLHADEIACPSPNQIDEGDMLIIQQGTLNPLIKAADFEAKAAHQTTEKISTESLPRVVAVGSVGYLSDSRVAPVENYSVWVGITLPLFEGFRISAEKFRARAAEDVKQNQLESIKLEVDDLNLQYDEEIQVARSELLNLQQQLEVAQKALSLSKTRYFSFLGPLIDLKEALRDLVQAETQIAEVKTKLLLAEGLKNLINGGTLGGSD